LTSPAKKQFTHLPITSVTSAEALAQQTISALQHKNLDDALGSAFVLHHSYPELPESHALYARVLADTGRFSKAFKIWDTLINRVPLEMKWLEMAVRLALVHRNKKALQRWTELLQRIFICPPSSDLLLKLDQEGWPVQGSAGIHCNKVMAWTWLASGTTPRIDAFGGAAPKIANATRQVCKNRVLSCFTLNLPDTVNACLLHLRAPDGKDIPGSPLAWEPAFSILPPKKKSGKKKGKFTGKSAVIMPVYNDKKATCISLAALLASRRACARKFDIVVVWDNGPDQSLLQYLHKLARHGKILLETTSQNMGFLGAVNHGLRRFPNRDIVLLNADTIVHGDWFDRLYRISRACPGTGTITPMGSFAELVSFPNPRHPADITSRRTTATLDQAFQTAAGKRPWQEIPVGVGFCMYITRQALNRIGGLDGRWLFRGYGEEVDFCLRAKAAGFKNLVALNVFVAHFGNRSFGLGKKALVAQNNKALFARYPEYDRDYRLFLSKDPLRAHREAVSRLLYTPLNGPLHLAYDWDKDSPGIDALRRQNQDQNKDHNTPRAALLLEDLGNRQTATLRVCADIPLEDIRFTLPREWQKLRHALEKLSPDRIILHNPMESLRNFAQKLDCPIDTRKTAKTAPSQMPLPLPKTPAIWKTDTQETSTQEIDTQETGTAWLVPSPRTLAGWHRLCSEARRQSSQNVFFYVMDLDRLWEQTPRPANIRPCPPERSETIPLARAMLLLENQTDLVRTWSEWAAKQNIPCYMGATA
jgi:GT2 family glycosyltransferase